MIAEYGLRARKKERTRRALVDAATTLFATKGYDETTVAEIAATADVSTRTFFGYFASKEEILFADTPLRLAVATEALATRRPGERPAELLLRAVETVIESDVDLLSPLVGVRVQLLLRTPSLLGAALRRMLAAERELARGLRDACPAELDEVGAAAMVGALVGALVNTLLTLLDDPDRAAGLSQDPTRARRELRRAVQVAVRGIAAIAVSVPPDSEADRAGAAR